LLHITITVRWRGVTLGIEVQPDDALMTAQRGNTHVRVSKEDLELLKRGESVVELAMLH